MHDTASPSSTDVGYKDYHMPNDSAKEIPQVSSARGSCDQVDQPPIPMSLSRCYSQKTRRHEVGEARTKAGSVRKLGPISAMPIDNATIGSLLRQ